MNISLKAFFSQKWLARVGLTVLAVLAAVGTANIIYHRLIKTEVVVMPTPTPIPQYAPSSSALTADDVVRQMINAAVAAEIKSLVSAELTAAVKEVAAEAKDQAALQKRVEEAALGKVLEQFKDVREEVRAATFRELREDAALRGAILTGQTVLVEEKKTVVPRPSEESVGELKAIEPTADDKP